MLSQTAINNVLYVGTLAVASLSAAFLIVTMVKDGAREPYRRTHSQVVASFERAP
jgi:hypothetical protein